MTDLKQTAIRVLAHRPVYLLMPPGALRACAALLYHGEHSSQEAVARRVRGMRGGIPTRYLAPAAVAARAAFRAGQDDLVEQTLSALERRFPEAPAPLVLRCDLHTFHGRYQAALDSAQRAQLLRPSMAAAARAARMGYRVLDPAEADRAAVEAVRLFPSSSEVLWSVCKECSSSEQYQRLQAAWDERVPGPDGLLRGVRPLSLAAARSGRLDAAMDLYRRAIRLIGAGSRQPGRVPETRLQGRGAWSAIEDLRHTLDGAGIRFFFAAGTALGLVRQGRPLSADSDIDVGIFDTDWDRAALIDVFIRDPRFDLDLHPQTRKVSLRHRGGSPVDVFRFYAEAGRIWHDGVFVRWHNTPFKATRREVRGLALPLPDDTGTYLQENYGDWRTPDPGFDAFTGDAPNLELTWPEYQRLHYMRRAYKRLTGGDAAGAGRDLARAGEVDLARRISA